MKGILIDPSDPTFDKPAATCDKEYFADTYLEAAEPLLQSNGFFEKRGQI